MNQSVSNLKLAERGAIISILTYLFLSAAKLAAGHLLHSSSLVADGFNNVSDIIGNVALLIGIRLARQPADRDHRFGHCFFATNNLLNRISQDIKTNIEHDD